MCRIEVHEGKGALGSGQENEKEDSRGEQATKGGEGRNSKRVTSNSSRAKIVL